MSDVASSDQTHLSAASPVISRSRRRPIATWIAFAVTIAATAAAAAHMLGGDVFDTTTRAARFTARVSLVFFMVVFSASTLAKIAPSALTRSLMRQRRAAGLAFAAAHGVHALHVAAAILGGGAPFGGPVQALSGVGYGLMVIMIATSNDTAVRRLGPTAWRRLHSFGSWYLWLMFFGAYTYRAPDDVMFAIPVAALGILAAAKIGVKLHASLINRAGRSPVTG